MDADFGGVVAANGQALQVDEETDFGQVDHLVVVGENSEDGVAFLVPFRRNPVRGPTGRARLVFGLALVAIVVHSLFYDALFEDPLFWAALALSAVAARAEAPA